MKKVYSMFFLMLLFVCKAVAQNEPITKISEISNAKAYTIASSRCELQVISGDTCLYTTNGSAEGLAEFDASDPNQQFALINGGKNFFLFSVGAGKFVDKTGKLTDEVTSDVVINVVETTNPNYNFNLNWGDNYYLNTQVKGNFAKGYLIDGWNTLDEGNQFQITEAAAFNNDAAIAKAKAYDDALLVSKVTYIYKCDGVEAYSYTKVTMGNSPLTVTYDGPGNRIGVSCSDETPASKEITANTEETVTYNFTIDSSTLPFIPTTIENQAFAEGTKWYYLQPYNTDTYCYTDDTTSKVYYKDTKGSHPIDLHYLFAFVGNPLSGFQIYNYSKGATMSIYGDSSSTYGNVTVSGNNSSKYFLEAGTEDGQYRFNTAGVADSYLNGYANELMIYTYGDGWASSDLGSQFIFAEVTEREIELALAGVLAYDPSYATGTIFRDGKGFSSLQVIFEGTAADEAIVIAEGMATGKITLVDKEGNVVATPTYAINAEDPTKLDITFESEFNKEGSYQLIIAEGLVKGATSGLINPEITLKYQFVSTFDEKIVTARIWKGMANYSDAEFPSWSTLPFKTHDDGTYYTCKVKITGKDTFVLMDWMNAGGAQDTIKVQFDPSKVYYNVMDFNNIHTLDEYGSQWIKTSTVLDPANYKGCWVTPSYSDASMNDEYGSCAICCYAYGEATEYVYILADWYMDDRYAMDEILPGKVYANAFQELDYTDADYPTFTQLPYDKTNGYYDIQVGIINDKTIVLKGYTGAAGEDLTIVYDPTSGNAVSFNGLALDDQGSSWITSSVIDGTNGGWYAYAGGYSIISYNKDTKSGYAVISGYDCKSNTYPYIFVAIGNYTPTVANAIKSIETTTTTGKPVIYNIAGQKLAAPRKGLNIINGKKVMY